MYKTPEELKEIIQAGRAIIPAETVIKGGKLINVHTQEIYPADIAIYKQTIVATGDVDEYIGENTQIFNIDGKYLAPGLIDGHIHVECSKLSMTSYAKAVLPHGTTSMISGLDEYISASGIEGLQEIFKEIKQTPLKTFWAAPYKTPYTFPTSTIACNFTPKEHEQLQNWQECYGVWETVREAVQELDEDTIKAISIATANRKPIFGCAPMVSGKDLNGYLCSGVRLDHESYDHKEVLEKLRKGMFMLIRESSVTHFLAENIKAITQIVPQAARRVSFCTDDVTANDLNTKGHLDNVVRLAIKEGIEPITAIQMATINSAEAYRIDHLVGSIAPGKIADILVVDSPETFQVKEVFANGKHVASNNKMIIDLTPPQRTAVLSETVKCEKVDKTDFEYKVDIEKGTAKVLSMDVKGPFVRKRKDCVLQVKDFIVQPDTEQDVIMVSVIERFGINGNKSLGFCSGWKLKRGAMASTAAPDDNNLIVMGVNPNDMAIAANYLIEQGGGQVIVADGQILYFLPLPVAGICSDETCETIAQKEKEINAICSELGCDLPEPMMYMFFLPITAIPDYAITDIGPVDCIKLDTFNPIIELNHSPL